MLLKDPNLFLGMSINGSKLKLNGIYRTDLVCGEISRAFEVAQFGVNVSVIGHEPCRSAKYSDALYKSLHLLVREIQQVRA